MDNPKFHLGFHAVAFGIWAILCIPTLLWWKNSIAWLSFMSIYAILAAELAALEAAYISYKREQDKDTT